MDVAVDSFENIQSDGATTILVNAYQRHSIGDFAKGDQQVCLDSYTVIFLPLETTCSHPIHIGKLQPRISLIRFTLRVHIPSKMFRTLFNTLALVNQKSLRNLQ